MTWREYVYSVLAAEVSASTRYFGEVREWSSAVPSNPLLQALVKSRGQLPSAQSRAVAYLLNGTLNYSTDIDGLLREIRPAMSRNDRIVAVIYNPYLSWAY